MKARIPHLQLAALCFILSGCTQESPKPQSASPPQAASAPLANPDKPSTISGVISDSTCGPNHSGMLRTGSMGTTDASCTLDCVAAGSRFVLVDKDGKVYKLSNQEAARKFAGEKVKVDGLLDERTGALNIQEITSDKAS